MQSVKHRGAGVCLQHYETVLEKWSCTGGLCLKEAKGKGSRTKERVHLTQTCHLKSNWWPTYKRFLTLRLCGVWLWRRENREILEKRNFHVLWVPRPNPTHKHSHILTWNDMPTSVSPLFFYTDCRLNILRQQVPTRWILSAAEETFGPLSPTTVSFCRAQSRSWPGCQPQTPGGTYPHHSQPSHQIWSSWGLKAKGQRAWCVEGGKERG